MDTVAQFLSDNESRYFDEDIHARNEYYRPERFRLGLRAWVQLWRTLSTLTRRPEPD
jgi:hypothetical protein